MKKHILIYLLCFLFIFPGFTKSADPMRRGLFISMIQDPSVLSSRAEITNLIDFAKRAHIQSLFVQIYRSNQAWFASKVGDPTPYETALKNLGEDPLKLLIKKAHASGIEVHAWLNLLSLGANKNAPILKKYGTAILTKNLKDKKTLEDYKIDSQYFLEPGDLRVREELSNMVGEILGTYPDLDGLQFDYIRYPDKNPHYGFTKMNVERFKKTTGIQVVEEESKVWKNWKRAQVTELLRVLINKARTLRPKIQISTTGCMMYVRAHDEAFQDWPSWLKSRLVDFVTIMSYPDEASEFEKYILDAKKRVEDFSKVNIGIGAYKFVYSPEVFPDELRLCEKSGGGACVIFHYGSLRESPALAQSLTITDARSAGQDDPSVSGNGTTGRD